ncbi:RluA family pseudouridine synthase [Bacillus sp. Marseille-P3661]|uniref:RluA family pseudouridine synthase n=1 Tax=Bacillus sp. Marseille-P3661 TaxID=1936234 RepID=UPI000C81E447|nr:RluA family pseudouridine synthase [Bacillus sp. Marseille-P3661]
MTAFKLQWKIDQTNDGQLVREYLLKVKGISKRALTDIKFMGGDILLNGQHTTVRSILKDGDVLTVLFPPEERSIGIVAENLPLNIVYEDEYILVIDKPPAMATIPSREHRNGTLSNALLYYYENNNIDSTIHIVNRLDRDTSGLLIVAKHRYIHHLMSLEQKKGTINRQYEAIVHGIVKPDTGDIVAPIGRKETSIIEREVRQDGQVAITHFHVIQRYSECTWLSLKLETGRTHQIRVHMAHIGHPLLGDSLYRGAKDLIERQALHSKRISFKHPISKEELEFISTLPEDMQLVVNR